LSTKPFGSHVNDVKCRSTWGAGLQVFKPIKLAS
jgi:hypothetical protein